MQPLSDIISELRILQRKRTVVMKGRIAQHNYLRAVVAGTLGYNSHLGEKERRKLFTEADKLIKQTVAGKASPDYREIILATWEGVEALQHVENDLEKKMKGLAKQLPVASWVDEENQCGFGLPSLAVIVGEAGDLSNYANPAKLWKRMGCAPFESDGDTKMGSTWKAGHEGKLSKEEWEEFGYSPRRCSLTYMMGESLLKQNKGEYRRRYDEAKEQAKEKHPDWKPLRCHRHAMLLMRKRLLRNLWRVWNNKPGCDQGFEAENQRAVLA